jgi:hypothetical protein
MKKKVKKKKLEKRKRRKVHSVKKSKPYACTNFINGPSGS